MLKRLLVNGSSDILNQHKILAFQLAIGESSIQNSMVPVNKISDLESFRKKVIASKRLALVKFGAAWSGTSEMITPIFNELAKEYGTGVEFFTVSVDESEEMETAFSKLDIPTIHFYHGGEVTAEIKGAVSKQNIASKIDRLLLNN